METNSGWVEMARVNAYTVNLIIFGMGLWCHWSDETDLVLGGSKGLVSGSASYGKLRCF